MAISTNIDGDPDCNYYYYYPNDYSHCFITPVDQHVISSLTCSAKCIHALLPLLLDRLLLDAGAHRTLTPPGYVTRAPKLNQTLELLGYIPSTC
jgi:hypothetical protein